MLKKNIYTYLINSDIYKRNTRTQKFTADGVQGGRSMIEMLGVLAIIAVLSVGGIAGFSKAMEQWKVNKWLQQIEDLIFNIKDAYKNNRKYSDSNAYENLLPTLKNIGAVPEGMLDRKNKDILGTYLTIYATQNEIQENLITLRFYTLPNPSAVRICQELFDLANKDNDLHSIVNLEIGVWFCGKSASPQWHKRSHCDSITLEKIFTLCQKCKTHYCVTHLYYSNE